MGQPKIWPRGPNYLKYECWGPGESIDSHIVGFCEKIENFGIWGQRALGPKIWSRSPNHFKNGRRAPGKSIETHIVRFCKKVDLPLRSW